MVQRGVLKRIKEHSLRGSRRKFNLHSQVCARRRIKIRHRSAHARRTHRQNGKETKACPGFCSKQYSFKITERSLGFFRNGCDRISYANCHIKGVSIKTNTLKLPTDLIFRSEYMKCGMWRHKDGNDFIHGGAFVGGTLAPYDESLKMLVDKFAVKVISIDYRLLPENAYPAPYSDCFDVLEYISRSCGEFKIDKDRILSAVTVPEEILLKRALPNTRVPENQSAASALSYLEYVRFYRRVL